MKKHDVGILAGILIGLALGALVSFLVFVYSFSLAYGHGNDGVWFRYSLVNVGIAVGAFAGFGAVMKRRMNQYVRVSLIAFALPLLGFYSLCTIYSGISIVQSVHAGGPY